MSSDALGRNLGDAIKIPRDEAHTPSGSEDSREVTLSWDMVRKGIHAVSAAIKFDAKFSTATAQDIQGSDNEESVRTLEDWQGLVSSSLSDPIALNVTRVALVMTFLLESGRREIAVSPSSLSLVWATVREALLCDKINWTISRSAQGFLAVPLWSVIENGNIKELFRLHVWLPDGQRGIKELSTHAHQPFAQSWTFVGEGENWVMEFEPADETNATHAEFAVGWADERGEQTGPSYKNYQVHSKSSTVVNTGRLFRLVSYHSDKHSSNMMYTVAAGVIHRSDIPENTLRATFFFWDSSRGYQQVAPVFGPTDRKSYTQERQSTGMTTATLVNMVDVVRKWEALHKQAMRYSRQGRWEESLRSLRSAIHIISDIPDMTYYKRASLAELGHTYRMLGRYEQASQTLADAISDMEWTQ